MVTDPEILRNYLASILLRSDAYEAGLNEQILGAMRNSSSAPEFVSPSILAGPPNRVYFIDSFLAGLFRLPFVVEIITPEEEVEQQIDKYEDGLPDPGNPGGLWRAMLLAIRLELVGGSRAVDIFLRELPCEELVLISFAFDSTTVKWGRWQQEVGMTSASDLPQFREFLLALIETYPVLVGTLGLDLDASQAGMPDQQSWREKRMSLGQLANVLYQPGSNYNFDFVFIQSAVAGGDRPFWHDTIEPRQNVTDGNAGCDCKDLRQVNELAQHLAQGEEAYDKMYDSKHPKDDRDDSLLFLSKAIKLAGALGLAELEGKIKKRYEHINSVFNSQFRGL